MRCPEYCISCVVSASRFAASRRCWGWRKRQRHALFWLQRPSQRDHCRGANRLPALPGGAARRQRGECEMCNIFSPLINKHLYSEMTWKHLSKDAGNLSQHHYYTCEGIYLNMLLTLRGVQPDTKTGPCMKCFKRIQNLLIMKPTDFKNRTFLLHVCLVLHILISVYVVYILIFFFLLSFDCLTLKMKAQWSLEIG